MTDLEITKRCAEAIGHRNMFEDGGYEFKGNTGIYILHGNPIGGYNRYDYEPLHDDAQAMALDDVILKAGYCISYEKDECEIYPITNQQDGRPMFHWYLDMTKPENRRRVRCECVAKMQKAKA